MNDPEIATLWAEDETLGWIYQYECIYEEAWDLEERGAHLYGRSGRASLTNTYASKDAFLRDVPRLIIEHNIHGIDIDPRAVQMAGLSLWLRAQKSWQEQGLKLSERPQIQKSNIVCAEPMPGEERLLDEFIEQHLADTPEQRLVGQLVRRVFEAMKLAGVAAFGAAWTAKGNHVTHGFLPVVVSEVAGRNSVERSTANGVCGPGIWGAGCRYGRNGSLLFIEGGGVGDDCDQNSSTSSSTD